MEFDLSRAKDGILLVDKPAGWTSFDVVAKIRGQIKHQYLARGEKPTKRQLKVGHAGTLDPFATGLLVILLGDATKKAGDFLKLDKQYEATICLGKTSTTGDPEGEITEFTVPSSVRRQSSNRGSEVWNQSTREDVERVLSKFRGNIQQRPPAYSAIKINGKRAYKLAREGREVEVPLRTVTIHSLEIVDYTYPELKIRTHVSSGTYIRSLAADIGVALETGAYCSELRRIRVGDCSLVKT